MPITHVTSGAAEDKEKGAPRQAPKGMKVSGFASLRLALSAAFFGALLYSPLTAAQSAAAPAQSVV
ncbi:hypothetical protein EN978_23860, partial [Mesorhizobium sp. M7A.F.Ca.US.001.04.1.1]